MAIHSIPGTWPDQDTKPSWLLIQLADKSEAFRSIIKTGFLEDVHAIRDHRNFSLRVRFRFSHNRFIEHQYRDDSDPVRVLVTILEIFTPDVLAKECLKIACLEKDKLPPAHDHASRAIRNGEFI